MYANNNEHIVNDSQYEDYNDRTKIISTEVKESKPCLRARSVFIFLGFVAFTMLSAMRTNITIAIVAMVNSTSAHNVPQNGSTVDQCPVPSGGNSTKPSHNGEFNWDETLQGLVLSTFAYGLVLTYIPGGRLAELFGGKLVFGCGVCLTAFTSLLNPIAARTSFPLFIGLRIIGGMAEGVAIPAMHTMIARWVSPIERNHIGAYIYTGATFGSVISLMLTGWLCTLEFMGGWPLAFYVFGVVGMFWIIFWMLLVYDSPCTHPWISEEERRFIVESVGAQELEDKPPLPWLKILTCLPLWAIVITQAGQNWAFYTHFSALPLYMSQILHFNIQENGILSALPHLTAWMGAIFLTMFADWLLKKGCFSATTSCKLFNSLATIIPSLGLIGVAWLGCDRMLVQMVLVGTGVFFGANVAGYTMNHIALSPKYAGTMCGLTYTVSTIATVAAPYVVAQIIEGQETLGQWSLVFYLAAGLNIAANLFYVAFASAEEQSWSKTER